MVTKEKSMTVGELIAALYLLPSNLEVSTEGCDCSGDVGSVTLENNQWSKPPSQYVSLNRSRG